MRRIVHAVLATSLALALGVTVSASAPAHTSGTTVKESAAKTPAKRPLKRKSVKMTKVPGDTVKPWPYNSPEGRTWITVSGEVIDVFCYLDRGFTGDVHRECAIICIKGGMPMGLLTKDGQVYLLMKHHDWAMDASITTYEKPYNQLIEWAARQVQVGGFLIQRKGLKGIEVMQSKLLQPFVVAGDSTGAQPPDSTAARP